MNSEQVGLLKCNINSVESQTRLSSYGGGGGTLHGERGAAPHDAGDGEVDASIRHGAALHPKGVRQLVLGHGDVVLVAVLQRGVLRRPRDVVHRRRQHALEDGVLILRGLGVLELGVEVHVGH